MNRNVGFYIILFGLLMLSISCDRKNKHIRQIEKMQSSTDDPYDFNLIRRMIAFSYKYPEDTTFAFGLGKYYMSVGRYDNAYDAYSKLIRHNPAKSDYYYHRARVSGLNKSYAQALDDINKAIDLNPNDSTLFKAKRIYQNLGQCQDSIRLLDSLLDIKPYDDNLYYERGKLYYKTSRFIMAAADFTNAINESEKLKYFIHRAKAYEQADSLEKALDDFRKVIELDTANQYAIKRQKEIQVVMSLKKEIRELDKIIERDQGNPEGYYARSKAYAKLREYDKALADINKAIEINPDNSDFYHARAVIYYRLEDYKKARKNLDMVIKYDGMPNRMLLRRIDSKLKDTAIVEN